MMPFSSVAIIEKLALVRIAFCKAPVLSNASWRRISVMPPALPAPSARVGPFSVLDMADFREKRTKDPERQLHLSGQQQKSATAHSQESNTPLPKRLSIIPVFPLTVCAVDHISRSP